MRKTVLSLCLMFVLAAVTKCNSQQSEPPLTFRGDREGLARSTELQDLDPVKRIVVYSVQYYNPRLSSLATLDLSTKAVLKEVFPGRWIISYHYDDTMSKVSHLPSSFEIHSDKRGGELGRLINTYSFKEIVGNGKVLYRDTKGNSKVIDIGYFEILPFSTF